MNAATVSPVKLTPKRPRIDPKRLVEYLGVVNYATNERVLGELRRLMGSPGRITLSVTSAGGPSGTAMSFYDTVRSVLRADLTTVGAGDVDSSGLVLFLCGTTRLVTAHTTALLHPAGRIFNDSTRYTTAELAAMLEEDRRKDALYADIVARNSRGQLSEAQVLCLMQAHTVLGAQDFVRLGLAEAVL